MSAPHLTRPTRSRAAGKLLVAAVGALLLLGGDAPTQSRVAVNRPDPGWSVQDPPAVEPDSAQPAPASAETGPANAPASPIESWSSAAGFRETALRSAPMIGLFALASLVPTGVLMLTAFVRIQIVLSLLRQALGSPQIPSNQVISALALLLSILVMMPVSKSVFDRGIEPFAQGTMELEPAWVEGTAPLKVFMIEQIIRTRHQDYLWHLYDYAREDGAQAAPDPTDYEAFPLRVVAPAFLLSELTTALIMGFAIYLPFLVIDLVVSAVLAAMGLILLPPTMVALPLKLILFVLADGWLLVADVLLRSFAMGG